MLDITGIIYDESKKQSKEYAIGKCSSKYKTRL